MLQAHAALQQGNVDQAMIAQGGYRSSRACVRGGKTTTSTRSTRAGRGSAAVVPRWVDEHEALMEAGGPVLATSAVPELTSMYPGLMDLTARELDILKYHQISYPERRKVTVELSQTIMRSRTKEGNTACVTPGMRRYLGHRCRIALGIEAMNLQCIRLGGGQRMRKAHAFPSALLQDLAGNASNALCDAACELALTVVLAMAHARHLQAVAPPVPEPSSEDEDDDVVLEELWASRSQEGEGD